MDSIGNVGVVEKRLRRKPLRYRQDVVLPPSRKYAKKVEDKLQNAENKLDIKPVTSHYDTITIKIENNFEDVFGEYAPTEEDIKNSIILNNLEGEFDSNKNEQNLKSPVMSDQKEFHISGNVKIESEVEFIKLEKDIKIEVLEIDFKDIQQSPGNVPDPAETSESLLLKLLEGKEKDNNTGKRALREPRCSDDVIRKRRRSTPIRYSQVPYILIKEHKRTKKRSGEKQSHSNLNNVQTKQECEFATIRDDNFKNMYVNPTKSKKPNQLVQMSRSLTQQGQVMYESFDDFVAGLTKANESITQMLTIGNKIEQQEDNLVAKWYDEEKIDPNDSNSAITLEHCYDRAYFQCGLCFGVFGRGTGDARANICKTCSVRTTKTKHGPILACNYCELALRDSKGLECHLRLHTGHITYNCSLCDQTFYKARLLKKHFKKHPDNNPKALCSVCKRTFHHVGFLAQHMRAHGESPYTCSHCVRVFTSKKSIERHILRTHLGKTGYECSQCGKKFEYNCHLQIHLRYHSGEKPFRCSYCPQRYSTSGERTVHVQRWHQSKRKRVCPLCSQTFLTNSSLRMHVKGHLGVRKTRAGGISAKCATKVTTSGGRS